MRKLPNGDALHHIKDTGVSTSFNKAKEPPRESSEYIKNYCALKLKYLKIASTNFLLPFDVTLL